MEPNIDEAVKQKSAVVGRTSIQKLSASLFPCLFIAMGCMLMAATTWPEYLLGPPPQFDGLLGLATSLTYNLTAVNNSSFWAMGFLGAIGGSVCLWTVWTVALERAPSKP